MSFIISSKEYEGKRRRIKKVMKVRNEVQEYLNKPLNDVLMKLKDDINNNKTFTVDITKQLSKYLYTSRYLVKK